MLALLKNSWRWLIVPVFALAFFLGAYFFFYRGTYNPPPAIGFQTEKITLPSSPFTPINIETPPRRKGLFVVDGAHSNNFMKDELGILLARVASRGYTVEMMGQSDPFFGFNPLGRQQRIDLLEEKLREADSFAVILPRGEFSEEEVGIVERFVRKGGKLLLIGDPGRRHQINTLAERFGISFQPDSLYNLVEHDLNFQDIFVRDFRPDEITTGLRQIALYTAGSVKSTGAGLAFTDSNTRSTQVERVELFYPLVKGKDQHVLAISDLTFMIPPQNSILDNDRLVSNIADYLTTSDRRFQLTDFPFFFHGDVDILIGRPSLLAAGTQMNNILLDFQVRSQVRQVEDLTKDTVFLGLYSDAPSVSQYLDFASAQLDSTLNPRDRKKTAVILLNATKNRHVLVVLADSPETLLDGLRRLHVGEFRLGLINDFVGVYRIP